MWDSIWEGLTMERSELVDKVKRVIRDPYLATFIPDWINEAIFLIATEFHLPTLRRIEPYTASLSENDWLYPTESVPFPSDYHKRLIRCENSTRTAIEIARSIEAVIGMDSDHSVTSSVVEVIGICDHRRQFVVYPRATDTLYMWYYKKPETLDSETSELLCIPAPYDVNVLVPKVILIGFQHLPDLMIDSTDRPLQYWKQEYSTGLYGGRSGDIGMVNYFLREHGVRRHGGDDPLP